MDPEDLLAKRTRKQEWMQPDPCPSLVKDCLLTNLDPNCNPVEKPV